MSDSKLTFQDLLGIQPETSSSNEEVISFVAIIGCGVIGRGIAWTVSQAGIDVLVIEKDEASLQIAQERLSEAMDREIQRWAMTVSEKKSLLSRITWSTRIEDVEEADLIIEAVDENFELKCEIFRKISEIAKPNTILVSNTSTFSLSEIAKVTKNPGLVIGMHFQHPVQKVSLVELVRGLETTDETVNRAKLCASKIGKTAFEVFEYPGFITTRCIIPFINEAMYAYMEGIASAVDIDLALKLAYNLQIGPLELADTMGLDELLAVMDSLWKTLGEPRFRACPILRKLVREKKLGKKVGEGFFKYNADGKIML
ncbi:MAG TPA: 3-hydroxyacyl-CoA dehydrogenase NAD-binding domain-containing protein [Ignavibacteriales bacterium]|nr:3-hydroxyacyl-CoA dehydrogenase NAD-binding domain-containing protein [Ignavibacteriales bacterium]